jgi:hypothetical protein
MRESGGTCRSPETVALRAEGAGARIWRRRAVWMWRRRGGRVVFRVGLGVHRPIMGHWM